MIHGLIGWVISFPKLFCFLGEFIPECHVHLEKKKSNWANGVWDSLQYSIILSESSPGANDSGLPGGAEQLCRLFAAPHIK